MFGCSRAAALAAIEGFGHESCNYAAPGEWLATRCDCKYGGPTGRMGEQTGCPELRTLHKVVSEIPDEHWDALLAQAGMIRP